MKAGLTVPYCGPIAIATRAGAEPLSTRSPIAWM